MSKGSGHQTSRLARCIKAPIRVLCRAECTDRAPVRNSVFPASKSDKVDVHITPTAVPHSVEKPQTSDHPPRRANGGRVMSRSLSVSVGRIDEDAPSDFFDPQKVESDLLLLRSRSLAVELRRRGSRARRV